MSGAPGCGGELWEILQASRNKLKAVFDAIGDPICSVTPGLLVESLNLALARRAGRHPRELVGISALDLLRLAGFEAQARDQFLDSLGEVLASGRPKDRLVEAESEQGRLYYEITVTPVLGPEGRAVLAILQVSDVTNFKRMEQTVREYSLGLEAMVEERTRDLLEAQRQLEQEKERLAQANAELRRLDTLRHDLTNMVVHDMKGPLAEVMGNLDLLGYDPLGDMQREALDLAVMGADDLLRMIMNLLDIDRLEEGRLRIKPTLLSFGGLAGELLRKFQTMIRLKGLEVTVDDQAGEEFAADHELLRRVLQNLLTNALNHTQEGGRVRLEARAGQDDGVLIRVQDDGEGIPLRHQERIFQKFTQANDGAGPRTSTGLGLTFCKMAVEAHGGRIWLESQEGQGASFFVWLPRRPAVA